MNPDPVVMLVVSLLAAAAMTNDRIVFTKRTSAYDDLVAVFCPVGSKLVPRDGDWDKEDRISKGFRLRFRPAKIIAGSGAPPPEENPTERKYTFLPTGRRAGIKLLAGYLRRFTRGDPWRLSHPHRPRHQKLPQRPLEGSTDHTENSVDTVLTHNKEAFGIACKLLIIWSGREDLNLRPPGPEPVFGIC
jgi:hypothetical protein